MVVLIIAAHFIVTPIKDALEALKFILMRHCIQSGQRQIAKK